MLKSARAQLEKRTQMQAIARQLSDKQRDTEATLKHQADLDKKQIALA